jgi:hypothetical protein
MNRIASSTESSGFTSNETMAKLWSLLLENGVFDNVANSNFAKVKEDFELLVQRIGKDHSQKSTMDKSKLVIDEMLLLIKKYKNQEFYTAQDIRQSKLDDFETELSKKQNEFTQLNSKPQPSTIDFSDKAEENTTNINELLESTKKERDFIKVESDPGSIITMLSEIIQRLERIEKKLEK